MTIKNVTVFFPIASLLEERNREHFSNSRMMGARHSVFANNHM
ncbi:hypothetical protein ACVWYG_001630 [Pedobacter sp. UYEF25]